MPAPASEPPGDILHVWNWFCEAIAGAASSGMGPQTLSWADLDAWTRLTGERPLPREIRTMMTLSVRRAEIIAEDIERRRPKPMSGPER